MLKQSILDANSRVAGYRSSARAALTKSVGGEVYGGSVDSAGSGGMDYQRIGKLSNQYRAAMTGIPYTAIRPAAVKIAGQPLRIGYKVAPGSEQAAPLRTKVLEVNRRKSGRVLLAKNLQMAQVAPAFVKQHAKNVEIIDTHPFLDAVEEPNEYTTQWALMWCTVFSLYATGHALWVMDEEGGRLKLYYVPITWAEPVHSPQPYSAWKIRPLGSSKDTPPIPGTSVVHFMLPDPANPLMSHAPLMAHSRAINTDDQIQLAQYASMKNGIRPGVILKAGRLPPPPGSAAPPMRPNLTPEQRKQLISAIQLAYRGAERYGEAIIVDGMIDEVVPFTHSPAEMDFQQGSKLTESRIMKGLGTNPIVAGEIEGANRASAYVAHEGFYEINVNPLISYMSQVITRRIGPLYSTDRQRVVAWIEEAQAYDKDLADARLKSLLPTGAISRGEARRWAATGEIDLPDRADDDELLKPPTPVAKPNDAAQGDGKKKDEPDPDVDQDVDLEDV